ncbi:MAG: hypothetical protein ABFD92_07775 [Planctomycetaceae bacterium]|nr:hypothetical protein [Planctomycetaceae bacterium]
MFIGSINRYMRAVLETAAQQWRGLPVYVACSGNFTVERILARCGVGAIHSNDVSIYSCALGWHLAGSEQAYKVKNQDFAWLGEYLAPGPATIATLLLTGEMLKVGKDNAYAQRMREQYRRRWPELHATTVERVTKALAGLPLASYFAGDCREFLAAADRDAVCISFPPTYKGGYERLFKKLDSVFEWSKPSYQVFSPEDFEQFSQSVRSFKHWMISSDSEQPALAGQHVATVQTSLRSKPVFMYCDSAPARYAAARQQIGQNPWAPRTDEVVEPIQVVQIDAKTMNAIRSLYLSQSIIVCDAPRNYAVLSDGRLLGAFSFALPRGPLPCDLYLLSDFAVRPTPHKRLSKLILACAVSSEVRADLEQWLCGRIRTIGTTAFTQRAVSMKYRGLFEVHNRSEGKVNYLGAAGRWSLQEGFAWWKANHSQSISTAPAPQ